MSFAGLIIKTKNMDVAIVLTMLKHTKKKKRKEKKKFFFFEKVFFFWL
jgi:hypothetical protein